MKKTLGLLISFSLFFAFANIFAYTSADISNAELLASQDIIIKQLSTKDYRLNDNITRAEAVGIALKIKWVTLPESYQCKNYYTDVKYNATNNWICRAVELAADNNLVSRNNSKFRPQDKITRAEALSIILKAQNGENSNNNIVDDVCSWMSATFSDKSDVDVQDWQKRIIARSVQLGIIEYCSGFYPNRAATRAEVFGFAAYKIILSTPVKTLTAQFYHEEEGKSKTIVFQGHNIMNVVEENNTFELSLAEAWYGHERQNSYIIVDPASCGSRTNLVFWDEYRSCSDALRINQIQGGVVTALWKVYVFWFGEGMNSGSFIATDIRPQSNFYIAMKLFERYYFYLNPEKDTHYFRGETAYDMRSPAWVSFETFASWYKDVTKVVFREDTMQDLWDNTYGFLIEMTENGTKSTYLVKSKVDLANFKINNISSVKQ